MIVVRRFFAVIFSVVFLVLFLATALAFRVNSTFLNANYLLGKLRDNDAYAFIYTGAIPAAVDALQDDEADDPDSILKKVDVDAVQADLIKAVQQVAPPEWIQEQVETAALAIMPYMLGDTDNFSFTVDVNTRIAPAGQALKEIPRGPGFDSIYNTIISEAADEVITQLEDSPVGIKVTKEQVEGYIKTIAPKEWLADRVDGAVDTAVPYLNGTSDHFTLTIPVADRVQSAGGVIKDVVAKSDLGNSLLDDALIPLVTSKVSGSGLAFPFGVSISSNELVGAIRPAYTGDWLTARVGETVDAVVGYMTGKTSSVSVKMPISDRNQVALGRVIGLYEAKLQASFNALRVCATGEMPTQANSTSLPSCRPDGYTYAQAKQDLGINPQAAVVGALGGLVPADITITDTQLKTAMGATTWARIEQARGYIINGYTYTDADLIEDLGADNVQKLNNVLDVTRNGYTLTDEKLRSFIADNDDNGEALANLDNARSIAHQVRTYIWFLIPLLILFSAGIGFLGGRNWGSRLAWAAVPLLIGSLVLVAVSGPVYSSVAKPKIEQAIADNTADVEQNMRPLVNKGIEIGWSMADGFMSGLMVQGGILMLVSIGAIGGGIYLQKKSSKPTAGKPTPAAA